MSRMHNKRKNPLPAIIVLLLIIIPSVISGVNSHSADKPTVNAVKNNDGNIVVHFLDVGQGDCEFIELPDGRSVLIDAGTSNYSQQIIDYITECGYNSIDYVIATHPHADHIGSMSYIIDSFDVGEVYMPKVSANTNTFERLLESVSDKDLSINKACAGVVIESSSDVNMEFLAPVSDNYDDLNNYSAVLKITYGSNSFLFTGDAEDISENEMLDNDYASLSSDVLKAGHHGSSSSSTADFLSAVHPQYAVISCGEDNSYGHPHSETLSALSSIHAEVYRTDKQGTITVVCDGKGNFDVEYEDKS